MKHLQYKLQVKIDKYPANQTMYFIIAFYYF